MLRGLEFARRKHQSKLIEAAKRVKSAATRRKMSEANKGKPKSAEHRQKTREANLGKTRTTECNAKIQARNIGRRLYKNNTTAERKYFYPGGFTTVPLDSWTPVVKP